MKELVFLCAAVLVLGSLGVLFMRICKRKAPAVPGEYVHPECLDCDKDCKGCSVHKYPDSLGDLDEDHVPNVNWSSGQDDVPPAPNGMLVFSTGKVGQALKKSKGDDVRISYHLATSLYGRLENLKAMTPAQLEVVKLAVKKLVDHLERAHKL